MDVGSTPGGHGHQHGHHHGHTAGDADGRRLWIALALIGSFMVAEVGVGLWAHSLALLSDAAHMLTDVAALGFAVVALRLAARPASGRLTYGWKRMEIFSAQANGVTLVLLSVALTVGAVIRLVNPPAVAGGAVLITACVGVCVNLAAAAALGGTGGGAAGRGLNIQGALAHVLSDLYAFAATALSGLIVLVTGFRRADAAATLVVAAIMIRSGGRLVRDSGRVLLEAAPRGLDPDEIGRAMAACPGVAEVHDLHVWEVSSGLPALSAHVLVVDGDDCHRLARSLRALLAERWSLEHATLQVDHADHSDSADDAGDRSAGTDRDGGAGPVDHCADPHGPVHRPVGPAQRVGLASRMSPSCATETTSSPEAV